jgi:hypothetical protein
MSLIGRFQNLLDIDLSRIIRRNIGSQEGDNEKEGNDYDPNHCQSIFPKSYPEKAS